MKSAFLTTLIMLALAGVATVLAVVYYPWPEPETRSDVDQLFESYEGQRVRGLEIVQFNTDRGALERIKLVRRGDRWIIPDKENFVATQGTRIALAINSLSALKVFDFISDKQQDHLDYGVVDPEDYQSVTNRSALGTKITLTDRNRKEIASLIVGLPVKNDKQKLQRFARVAGQPNIYVVNYDKNILTTDLGGWISTNPLQLATGPGQAGNQIDGIVIDNYRMEGPDLEHLNRKTLYRAELRPSSNRLGIAKLQAGRVGSDELRELNPTPEHVARLTGMVRFLGTIVTNDVKRKAPKAARAIRSGEEFDPADVESMKQYGFINARHENGDFVCDAVSGQIHVSTPDGVIMSLSVGQIAGAVQDGSGRFNYYVIITARVDETRFQPPEKPANLPEDPESSEYKTYMRSVEEVKQRLANARQSARGINSLHGDWYYLIADDMINLLRPEIDIPPETQPASESSEPSEQPPAKPDATSDSNQ